jgi:hypothetical protein
MNAFEQIHAVVTEAVNGFDVLRIIAKDSRGLSKDDRASIASAADELEDTYRRLIKVHFEFCQLQQRLIAVNDQLLEARQELAEKRKVYPSLSLTTGPIPISPWSIGVGK